MSVSEVKLYQTHNGNYTDSPDNGCGNIDHFRKILDTQKFQGNLYHRIDNGEQNQYGKPVRIYAVQVPFKVHRQKQRHQQHQIFLHLVGFLHIIKNTQRICSDKTVNSGRQSGQSKKQFSTGRLPGIETYHCQNKHDNGHQYNQQTAADICNIISHQANNHGTSCFHLHASELCRCIRIRRSKYNPEFSRMKSIRNIRIVLHGSRHIILFFSTVLIY